MKRGQDMRLVAYARVSTEHQSEGGHSLGDQEAKLRSYCDLYGHELVTLISVQESAKSLKRKGLNEALDLIRSGQADGIVITKLDRLTRSMRDFQHLLDKIFSNPSINAGLHSVGDMLDTSSASGRLVLNVMMSFAQFEREAISERTKAALQHKQKTNEGKKLYGHPPFGWSWVYANEDERRLEPVELEQKALVAMIRLRSLGETYQAIADKLAAEGVLTKTGKPRWYPQTIKSALNSKEAIQLAERLK